MFFPFLVIISISEEVDCTNFFLENHEICNESTQYREADTGQKYPCSLRINFASPVGWYGYDSPPLFYFNFFETNSNVHPGSNQFSTGTQEPTSITKVNQSLPLSSFEDFCPMYNSRSKDPKLEGRQTCCMHLVPGQYSNGRDASYTYSNMDMFKKRALFRIYPKCYDLIRYMPCAICHPKIHLTNVTYIVQLTQSKEFGVKIPTRTYRICNKYAEEIWHQCRRAFYLTDGLKLIVPEDMGLEQFKDMVGVPEYHGLPEDTCLDIEDVNPFY